MKVLTYNCQNFASKERRCQVLETFDADYVCIQGTRMREDPDCEVVKERIGKFNCYHFGYQGKANSRNSHAGLTIAFQEDLSNVLECYGAEDDPDITGRVACIRFKGSNHLYPGCHDVAVFDFYFPPNDGQRKTRQIYDKMFIWLLTTNHKIAARSQRIHCLDGNWELGFVESQTPLLGDAVGSNRKD